MIEILSKCEIKESERLKFIQTATQLINLARDEAGCISYEMYHDLDNENVYFFIEKWKSIVHLNYHEENAIIKKYINLIKDCLNIDFEIHRTQKSI